MNKERQFVTQRERIELWKAVWLGVSASSDCRTKDIPTIWADHCLKDFDERFAVTTEKTAEVN